MNWNSVFFWADRIPVGQSGSGGGTGGGPTFRIANAAGTGFLRNAANNGYITNATG